MADPALLSPAGERENRAWTLLGACLALLTIGAAPAPPKRIVSMNLCADQLVLALADRGQIAALTRNAADPAISAAAAKARGIPVLSDSSEQLLVMAPDLIVAPRRATLGGRTYRTLDLGIANSYAEIEDQVRQVAAAVGHPARGAALIARMRAGLAPIPKVGRGRVAAYYQRRGYMTGGGTLVDEMMGRLGLVNLATKLGKPALSQLSLEEMVAARPDFLIMESGTARVADQGTEMLHHPALRGMKRLWIPQAWTVCGSPEYVLAARMLARQVGR